MKTNTNDSESYVPAESLGNVYNLNIDWKFFKPSKNTWPLQTALDGTKNSNGKYFYEPDFDDSQWEEVSLPHTFNDEDSFDDVISDAGEQNLYRGIVFYRKNFSLPNSDSGKKVFVEFEGIRQAAYVYLNGVMVGYYEAGVAPFGFDLSKYIRFGEENVLAVAADNTSSREAAGGEYINETRPGTPPGSNTGTEYKWNTKDFNPIMGGLSRNVKLHVKHNIYQTLPLYRNLATKGTYIYADNIDVENKSATINVESEVRNESDFSKVLTLEIKVAELSKEKLAYTFVSDKKAVPPANDLDEEYLTTVPEDAYEDNPEPTKTESRDVTIIKASATVNNIKLWSPDAPYLYDVYTILKEDNKVIDVSKTTTGFRKVELKNGAEAGGIFINDKHHWLRGYAQRATNEWAAIGIAPDWLRDYDAKLIRESNANYIRWMHIAAQPVDIRACDKTGIVCVQPAGDKEHRAEGRKWNQRVETMHDVIIYFRNSVSVLFWEAGNTNISAEQMREMTNLRKVLDPARNAAMGCRSLCEDQAVEESEWVGTMLGRRIRDGKGYKKSVAERIRDKRVILETEYTREESPRRVWDDYSPPDFDYANLYNRKNFVKMGKNDYWDLTSEDFVVGHTASYYEFYSRRLQSDSETPYYSAAAALCWSDSNQHGRQEATENARMSGRVDPVRIKKQSFYAFKVMHNPKPDIYLVGHWNYPTDPDAYLYELKDPETNRYTGKTALRNAENKTIYVIGSEHISKVGLVINGEMVGIDQEAKNGFLYKFEGINIMQPGYIEAIGYNEKGEKLVNHKIETVGEVEGIRLTPITGPEGLRADGSDIAFIDIELVDRVGRVYPLDYDRIDFEISGPAVIKGGYNSGIKNLRHRNNYVFAECGRNRLFIKSTREAGPITVKVKRSGIRSASITIESKPFIIEKNGLTKVMPQVIK